MRKTSTSDMVAAALLERVLKGEWQVGERIPSIDQLEKVFPVSRVTISKGIRKLCRQGYLHSAWRSGTFVRSNVLVRRILLHVGGDPAAVRVYPFSMVMTRKLEKLLAERGMQVEIHWEGRQPLAGSRLATDLEDSYFEGIVSVQSNLPVMIAHDLPALRGKLPTVHVGIHHLCPWVFVDMAAFNRLALARVRAAEGQRVLYMCAADSPLLEEFQAPGMTVHALAASEDELPLSPSEGSAYELFLGAWKRLAGKIDAVVSPDDIMAKGVAQAVLSLGGGVAERLRIVSLTNKDSGVFYPLPIEAIEVDGDEVARAAIRLLEDQFARGARAEASGVAIAPQLVEPVHSTLTA